MRWEKGTCSYCRAGEGKKVNVYAVTTVDTEDSRQLYMCRICVELGVSRYQRQNGRPVTIVELSRAVRFIVAAARRGRK